MKCNCLVEINSIQFNSKKSSRRDFFPVTRHFFAPSLYILYTADFNYLIRWVIVTYILLDISVVNSHATSAY